MSKNKKVKYENAFVELSLQEFEKRMPKIAADIKRSYPNIDFTDTNYIVRMNGESIEIGYREDTEWEIKNPLDTTKQTSEPSGMTYNVCGENGDCIGSITALDRMAQKDCTTCKFFCGKHNYFSKISDCGNFNVKKEVKGGIAAISEEQRNCNTRLSIYCNNYLP